MALVVTHRDRNLLKNSDVIKDEHWLVDLLDANTELSEELVADLPAHQQSFLQNMIKRYIQEATKEWTLDNEMDLPAEDLGNERTTCLLCGNTQNRYVYYIVNKLNRNKMNVGSSCKDEFGFELSADGRSGAHLMRDAKRLRRETELNAEFPGVSRIIHGWSEILDDYDVVIPTHIEGPFQSAGERAKKLFDAYLDQITEKQQCFSEMEQLLSEYDSLLQAAEKHVEVQSKRRSPFVAHKRIGNWLRRNQEGQGLEWIKEDGEIRWRTAFRICEPQFMESIIPLLNDCLGPVHAKVERADPDRKGYVLSFNVAREVLFFISHVDLIKEYGGTLTGEDDTPPDVSHLMGASAVVLEEYSVLRFVEQMNKALHSKRVEVMRFNLERREVFVRESGKRTYYQHDLRNFVDANKWIVAGVKRITDDHIKKHILTGKALSQEEFEQIFETRQGFGRRYEAE